MNTHIGIDLGTSSVKLLAVSEEGRILKSVTENYPISYPQSGWSEQNPEDWFAGVMRGLKKLLSGFDKSCVKGIGIGGQMHGLVILDRYGNIIRPAILWNDGRTQKQTDYLNEIIGKKTLSKRTANIAFAGFTAPKLLWVKENEPKNFERINKILLPKDYVLYRLTGVHGTDYSDASGTLLLDVKQRSWNEQMLSVCDVRREQLPELYESYAPVGKILPSVADDLGLPRDVVLCAGAGDNAAAAVGTGAVHGGDCNISLGTSGTVFIVGDKFTVDNQNALHSFCHANGGFHLMGCILSAASCNEWWMNVLSTHDYEKEQRGLIELLGRNNVFFLPYLMGERSPHNDVNARGAFIGMRPDTKREQMTLAILEGVAFALRDCLEVAKSSDIKIKSSRICGGGAKSKLWRQVVSDITALPVETLVTEEGPAYGGAILSMVSCGKFSSVEQAADALVSVSDTVYPDLEAVKKYEDKYSIFKRLYPALKDVFGLYGPKGNL